jgi:transposase
MLGPPKRRCLDQRITVSLEQLVPQDSFYRYLDATLDLSFVRTWAADRYAEGGRPSIDPVVFFKLQLVMFFEGIRSERQLMRVVADRLSVRWYLGYDFDEPLPDHSSLTRIRERLGLPVFRRFFEHVVELCREAGLVWGKELFFDATKIRANADVDSLVPRWYAAAKAHLTDLFAGDADVAGAGNVARTSIADHAAPSMDHATATGDAPHPPFAGSVDEERRLAEENRTRWRLLEQLRLDPARPAARGYRRTADLRVSSTDPDAAPMCSYPGERTKLGYHDHYVVDGGKARIILAALVTPADVMENAPMLDLLWRARFRWKVHPKRAVGDTTYGTAENIQALEEAGIRAYVPLPDIDERTPYVGVSHFRYDAERDEYRCPQGHALRRVKAKYTEAVVVYRAAAAVCNACPLKARCTASDRGRQVQRPFAADYLERVRGYHGTAAYQKAMRKRQVWVEPLFGEAKDWHGLRRFRLRGLWKVNTEGLLVAAGQNLKRWLTKTGWGRRHGPAGSLALSRRLSGTRA